MDDLKLYKRNDYELDVLLKTVKTLSDDIDMAFGLDKCAKATLIRGKLKYTSPIVLDTDKDYGIGSRRNVEILSNQHISSPCSNI